MRRPMIPCPTHPPIHTVARVHTARACLCLTCADAPTARCACVYQPRSELHYWRPHHQPAHRRHATLTRERAAAAHLADRHRGLLRDWWANVPDVRRGVSPSGVWGRAPAGCGAEPCVAAAYGDGSEWFWRARTHICLLYFGEAERFEGGNMHNFLSTSRWYQCFSVLHSSATAGQ